MFLAWRPAAAPAAESSSKDGNPSCREGGIGAQGEKGGGVSGNGNSSSNSGGGGARLSTATRSVGGFGSGLLALSFLRKTGKRIGGARELGETIAPYGDESNGDCAARGEGSGSAAGAAAAVAVSAAGGCGTGGSVGTGGDGSKAVSSAPATVSWGSLRETRRESSGKSDFPDPDEQGFRRVYNEFYKNLVEAKGVPSGFKSCTTKSMDEGMSGIPLVRQGRRLSRAACASSSASCLSLCWQGRTSLWKSFVLFRAKRKFSFPSSVVVSVARFRRRHGASPRMRP